MSILSMRSRRRGEPVHTDGFEIFLAAGADITRPCVLAVALQACGYVPTPDHEAHGFNYIRVQ
jgi:hypothetical protein